ncbi:LysR substrate-binding domain-containing protein [Massilia solisilvae]|uniref:LysR substrate-binding domain-containing protein n=1 Tax=Massilia solisilvae TaxID=1811225 RepID=A0ABT2BGZ7_9BURK|nr:LysR substrate-binding domain-containing protein [Massilia solisilvae]MCS0607797.1 LysR substrate-binding domain-containing protein [Massilia solisilvae]
MRRVNFDLDAMRTFCLGMELGSFAKAADRLGRSTSAVSAQLKKLEEQAGTALASKAGRHLVLTDAGELLLSYARRLLELNDEAWMALGSADLAGAVRLGLQEDFGEHMLSEMLGRFARTHPSVRIEARVGRNADLIARIEKGELDLALAWNAGDTTAHMQEVGSYALQWIGPADASLLRWQPGREPLPLVAVDGQCVLRKLATEALDRAGTAWRLAFTSPSLGGVWAAVAAGLGVTVRTGFGLAPGLRIQAGANAGLPALGCIGLALHRSAADLSAPAQRLEAIILDSIRDAQARMR